MNLKIACFCSEGDIPFLITWAPSRLKIRGNFSAGNNNVRRRTHHFLETNSEDPNDSWQEACFVHGDSFGTFIIQKHDEGFVKTLEIGDVQYLAVYGETNEYLSLHLPSTFTYGHPERLRTIIDALHLKFLKEILHATKAWFPVIEDWLPKEAPKN